MRREEGLTAFLAKVTRVASQTKKFGDTFQSWSYDKQHQGALRRPFWPMTRESTDLVRSWR